MDKTGSMVNTIGYHQGHAEGMREAIKAVKAIREFPKRNYLDMPQRLTDFMSGVLEECERQLRYNEATCIKAIIDMAAEVRKDLIDEMNEAKEETEEN